MDSEPSDGSFIMRRAVLCLAMGLALSSLWAEDELTKADNFTLKTPGFSVVVRPEAAYTIGGITYRGMTVGKANGNYGFVVSYEGTNFVGSGHTEGGREKVTQIVLSVDGQEMSKIPLGREVNCEEAILKKTAMLGDAVEIDCVTHIAPEVIKATHIMRVKQDVTLANVYPFMFIWPETTTEFMSGLLDGRIVESQFDNAGWEVQGDARWMAVFEPDHGIATITIFPENMPRGRERTRKHTFWDLPAYHKQYFIFASRENFTAGQEFRFDVEVRLVEADPANWKEKVKAMLRGQGITIH